MIQDTKRAAGIITESAAQRNNIQNNFTIDGNEVTADFLGNKSVELSEISDQLDMIQNLLNVYNYNCQFDSRTNSTMFFNDVLPNLFTNVGNLKHKVKEISDEIFPDL